MRGPVRVAIEQGEFHLGGAVGGEAMCGQPVQHGHQSGARIAGEGRSVLHHHDRVERLRAGQPGHGHRAPPSGLQGAVRIAAVEHQRAVLDVPSEDIQIAGRKGHPRLPLLDLRERRGGQSFAAGGAVQVGAGDAKRVHQGSPVWGRGGLAHQRHAHLGAALLARHMPVEMLVHAAEPPDDEQ